MKQASIIYLKNVVTKYLNETKDVMGEHLFTLASILIELLISWHVPYQSKLHLQKALQATLKRDEDRKSRGV